MPRTDAPLARPDTALPPRANAALFLAAAALLLGDAWRLLDAVHPAAQHAIPLIALDRFVVVAAIAMLIALGLFRDAAAIAAPRAFAIGALVGLFFFARTLGLALADPSITGWLMHNDWAQHYSGWVMFRHAPWHWPPGAMPEISYPVGTSIVFTDSLPLFALALKPFSAVLPEPFQTIGLWILICAMLQGAVAAVLVARFARATSTILIGAALFVFAPVFLNRIGHDTLMAQWLILAAFALYLRTPRDRGTVAEMWPWWVLIAIAALVHPYLAAMTFAIQLADAWRRVRADRGGGRRVAGRALLGSLALAIVLWALAGAFILTIHDTTGGIRYGHYSMNLLALVNPRGFSRLLPTLPDLPGQYEGFAYLGAGMLALAILALCSLRTPTTAPPIDRKPLVVVAALLFAFAASSVLAIGSWTLIDLPIRSPLLGAFRSSGRFVWVAYYAIMIAAIAAPLRRWRATIVVPILLAALALQLFDVSTVHVRYARMRAKADVADPAAELHDPGWSALAAGRSHLTLLPGGCGESKLPYLPFVLFAARHGMTVNTGYLARWNQRATWRYCGELEHVVDAGALSTDDLYVVDDAWRAKFEHAAPDARCEVLDGYRACVVAAPR